MEINGTTLKVTVTLLRGQTRKTHSFLFVLFFCLVPQEKKLAQTISSSKLSCGDVCKRHIKHFVNRKPYKIFRKDGGIPEDFQRRVCNAMSLEKPYNVLTFNCLHFALWLLGDDGKNSANYV